MLNGLSLIVAASVAATSLFGLMFIGREPPRTSEVVVRLVRAFVTAYFVVRSTWCGVIKRSLSHLSGYDSSHDYLLVNSPVKESLCSLPDFKVGPDQM